MVINPNIILSGNQMAQPRLPDVNAMMQTRTAGLENIYKIEQQRAEQAKAAQKEQEAALVEALAPAYATAFKGGGSREAITAAYNLLPPEIQSSVKGQIDRLLAMPSDDLRLSALEASMAGSEMGRTLLDRVMTPYQEATLGIQRGNLELSKAELAQRRAEANKPETMTPYQQAQIELEREKLAQDKEPKVAFRETDAEGNVRMYDEAGNEIGLLPKAGKPAAAAGGTAATESERLAGYNAGRALDAAKRISTAITTDPEATAPGLIETAVGRFVDPNILRGEERQRVSAAQRELIDALLTLATGAAYNREQLEGQMESYIPKWSDREGTREDKRTALLGLIQNAKIKAGRAWTPQMDAAFEQLLTPPVAQSAPAAGGIREGATATNPQTGERIIYRNGQWQPL